MGHDMPKIETDQEKTKDEGVFVPKERSKSEEVTSRLGRFVEIEAKFVEAGFTKQDAMEVDGVIHRVFAAKFPGTGKIDGSSAATNMEGVRKDSEDEITVTVEYGTHVYRKISNWEVKLKKVDGVWKLEEAVEL